MTLNQGHSGKAKVTGRNSAKFVSGLNKFVIKKQKTTRTQKRQEYE